MSYRLTIKNLIIGFSGFLFGISGLIFELLPTNTALRYLVIVLGSILLIILLKGKINKKAAPIIFLFVLYFFSTVVTIFIHDAEFIYLFRDLYLLFVVYSIYVLVNSKYIYDFFIGFALSIILLSVYYFTQIDYNHFLNPYYRSFAEYGANGVGKIASFTLIILIYSYIIFKDKWRFLLLFFIAVNAVLVVATMSRTAFLVLGFTWIMSLYVVKNNRYRFMSILLVIGLLIYFNETILMSFRLEEIDHASGESQLLTLTGRTHIWAVGLELIKDNFIFGIGPEKAGQVMISGRNVTMDNTYLAILLSNGLLGLIPIITIILISIYNALRSIRNSFLFAILFIGGMLNTVTGISLLTFGMPDNFLIFFLFLFFSYRNKKLFLSNKLLSTQKEKF